MPYSFPNPNDLWPKGPEYASKLQPKTVQNTGKQTCLNMLKANKLKLIIAKEQRG